MLFDVWFLLIVWLIFALFRRHRVCSNAKTKILEEEEEEEENADNSGKWDRLLEDVVNLIVKRLNLKQRIRMSAVCKSWSSLPVEEDSLREASLKETPWLLLPQDPANLQQVSFLDITEGEVYNFEHNPGGFCCGSCRGWLIMSKPESWLGSKPEVFLWNPITGVQYQLPPFQTVDFYRLYYFRSDPDYLNKFVFLSEEDEEDMSQCTVAALFDDYRTLAFCKPGGKRWSKFQNLFENELYEDMLFLSGTLVILMYDKSEIQTRSQVHTFRSKDSKFEVKLRFLWSPAPAFGELTREWHPSFRIDQEATASRYLVKSTCGNQLFLVRKTTDVFINRTVVEEEAEAAAEEFYYVGPVTRNCVIYFRAHKFDVYRYDEDGKGGLLMERLENFGDEQVLFLNRRSTFLRPSTDVMGRRCIYFADDKYLYRKNSPLVSRDSGVYNLDTKRFLRLFPSDKLPESSATCWFTPSPCSF